LGEWLQEGQPITMPFFSILGQLSTPEGRFLAGFSKMQKVAEAVIFDVVFAVVNIYSWYRLLSDGFTFAIQFFVF
jgi:hypothetical protein